MLLKLGFCFQILGGCQKGIKIEYRAPFPVFFSRVKDALKHKNLSPKFNYIYVDSPVEWLVPFQEQGIEKRFYILFESLFGSCITWILVL